MSTSEIKAAVDAIAAEQVSNQFGTQRYALLFRPGTYGTPTEPLNFQVGYYTEVAGLGSSPSDVVVNGTIDVYNQCFGPGDCTALVNFWRSLSNLTINVAGKSGCQTGEFWAASQAAPMRRVHVNGFMTLMDYCSAPSFASGGFIADSQLSEHRRQRLAAAVPRPEQQPRRPGPTASGTRSSPASRARRRSRSRTRRTRRSTRTPPRARSRSSTSTRSGRYKVFVADARFNSSGVSWANGLPSGRSIPIDAFFIAKPGDSVKSINNALSHGKHLLFTPGVYDVDRTIKVKRPGTIVLGLGMATLTAQNGVIPMTVADVKGVDVAG